MNKFLEEAFLNAEKAYNNNEVPIGAVIVKNNEIISYGFNLKEKNSCVLDHAELIAIAAAEQKVGNWRLDDCDIYVTLDPCPMCASAIKQARIKNVYSALTNSDKITTEIIKMIFLADKTNPPVNLFSNLSPEKSRKLLNSFFEKQRNK